MMVNAVATGAPRGLSPWLMAVSVLTQPASTLARLRGRPTWLPPFLAIWAVNVLVAYLHLFLQAASGGAQSAEAESFVSVAQNLGPYTSPVLGTLLNLVGAAAASAILLAAAAALAGGESRLREAWALALYAAVPSQLIGALVRVGLIFAAPNWNVPVRGPLLLAIFQPTAGSGNAYMLSLLDPLSLWSLGLLIIGLSVVMKLSLRRSASIAGGLYLLAQATALLNAAVDWARATGLV